MNSAALARTIISALVREGVSTFVLAPGSRSAPLAYALNDAEAAGLITLHVETDERVAGFLALGSAIGGSPAAIVTTSGTAVANLHPAVEEAHHSGVPLVVLSADRPLEARGTRASQTTDHLSLLRGSVRDSRELPAHSDARAVAGHVRRSVRIARGLGAAASGPGPVHINVGFDIPLTPEDPWSSAADDCAAAVLPSRDERRTVVVAGPSTLADLDIAVFEHVPVLAEPTSGLWAARSAMTGHPILLGSPLRDEIERVVVVGHPTLTREIAGLLADPAIDVVVIDEPPTYTDTSGNARLIIDAAQAPAWLRSPKSWLERWQAASGVVAAAIEQNLAGAELSQALVARRLSAAEMPTFLGASSIIREVNLYASPGVPFLGNRGLAGIDGTISTALGYGAATGRPTRVVLGDLAALHDVGGLARTVGESVVPLDVVVVDDHGGSIFAGLEHGDAPEDAYRRVFRTEKSVDVAHLAAAFGAEYVSVESGAKLDRAFATPFSGTRIVHVELGRETARQTRDTRANLRDAVSKSLNASFPGLVR